MNIRKATLKDIPDLVKLWKDFNKEHEQIVSINKKSKQFDKKNKNFIAEIRKYFKKNIKSKKGEIFIVEKNNKIIAFELIIIEPDAPISLNKNVGIISDLFIKKEFRKKGLALELNKEAVKWFKSKKIKHMSLNVNPNNKKAIKLYNKLGFTNFMINMMKATK